MHGDYDLAVEVIVLGQASVGKSNLITRYVRQEFSESMNPTIGNDYFKSLQRVNNVAVLAKFWDTAGQERFASLSTMILKNINAAVFVYDITKRESFAKIPMWLDFVRESNGQRLKFMLVGNKMDLESEREVAVEEARQFAAANDMLFFETSAKTNQDNCVSTAMSALVEETAKAMIAVGKERTSMVNGELVKAFKKIELGQEMREGEKGGSRGSVNGGGEKKGCC